MLVLFETPAGYALFKLTDESKLATPDALQKSFEDPESAAKVIKLKAFGKFADTVEVKKNNTTTSSHHPPITSFIHIYIITHSYLLHNYYY